MKLKASVYPFSHHNVFIPEHLKIMIESEVERTGYRNINTGLYQDIDGLNIQNLGIKNVPGLSSIFQKFANWTIMM